jgi:regulator of protease activity HflC (stomatin/prohibitin superfamily)
MNRLATAMAAIVLTFAGTACTIIEDGEVGVLKTFGSIADEALGRGPNFVFPVVRQIEKWNIKRQDVKETADVPSSEGLIVRLETSLQFRVKPDMAPFIRKNTGRNYRDVLLVPYFRNEIRDVVSAYPVRSIYSEEGRTQIAGRVQENLQKSLEDEGIEILVVLLRDVQLPARFKESIEAKLTAEQRVQQKDFELAQAKKDAEIEVARARGAAQAQEIVRSTLSSSYLHYLWIKTLNENPNVIYVATEANMPIFKNVK